MAAVYAYEKWKTEIHTLTFFALKIGYKKHFSISMNKMPTSRRKHCNDINTYTIHTG